MRSSLTSRGKRAFVACAAAAGAAVLIATAFANGSPVVAATDPALVDGKSIFQTGRDIKGVRIAARPPALFPACASCHLPNGAGGIHLPGGAVSADLRRSALVSGQKHPYTVTLLERAIATGIDDDGKRLSPVMPRWTMSKRDLHDVAEYVLTLR